MQQAILASLAEADGLVGAGGGWVGGIEEGGVGARCARLSKVKRDHAAGVALAPVGGKRVDRADLHEAGGGGVEGGHRDGGAVGDQDTGVAGVAERLAFRMGGGVGGGSIRKAEHLDQESEAPRQDGFDGVRADGLQMGGAVGDGEVGGVEGEERLYPVNGAGVLGEAEGDEGGINLRRGAFRMVNALLS